MEVQADRVFLSRVANIVFVEDFITLAEYEALINLAKTLPCFHRFESNRDKDDPRICLYCDQSIES